MSNNDDDDDDDFNSDEEEEMKRIEEEQERELEEEEERDRERKHRGRPRPPHPPRHGPPPHLREKRERERLEREAEEHEWELEKDERDLERAHRGRPGPPHPPGRGPAPRHHEPPIPPHLRGLETMSHFMMFDEGRFEEEEFYRNRRRKNITIRGLKSDLYEDFSYKMQSMNFNIGIVFSKMMSRAYQKFNGEFPTINVKDIFPPKKLLRLHINRLASITISKADLEETQAKLTLDNIKLVKLEEDLTDEILKKYFDSINRCEKVLIPKSIPKLVALSLLNKCGSYEFYSRN